MKKLITLSAALLLSLNAFAQDSSQMKEMSLKACESQAEQLPDDQKAMTLKMCKCTVENTDYEAITEASKTGDTEAIQANAIAVSKKCAAEYTSG